MAAVSLSLSASLLPSTLRERPSAAMTSGALASAPLSPVILEGRHGMFLKPTSALDKASSPAFRRGFPALKRRHAGAVQAGLLDFLTKPKKALEEKKAKEREELKAEILELVKPLDRGAEASPEDEEEVEQIVQRLEALNPTKDPVRSPLINGKWELQYTTSSSISKKNLPKLLRQKGPIYQCLDTETLQARNIETWPFYNQVQATLTPLSGTEVDVKFDYFKIAGLISIKAPESSRGSLEITYLDDEVRIARGNRGNLFILTMVDPLYTVQ